MVCEYEYDENTQRMRVNCLGCIYGKSIEDYPICMATAIDKLIELRRIPRIVFAGTREYEYDFDQARLLFEIANAIMRIKEEKLDSIKNLITHKECDSCIPERISFLRKLLLDIKYDPINTYKKIVRAIRHLEIRISKLKPIQTNNNETYDLLYPGESYEEEEPSYGQSCIECIEHYIDNSLTKIKDILDRCSLIKRYLEMRQRGELIEKTGERSFYRKMFHPTTKPNFMYTRFLLTPPANSELIERYKVGDAEVEIYKTPGSDRKLYHLIPPEFRLNDDEYALLESGRKYLGTHAPKEAEIEIESEKFRENMFSLSLDMLKDLLKTKSLEMDDSRLKQLANILARYTSGLGILELFLSDEKIQDIVVNSPIETIPVYIVHSDYFECSTNIIPSHEDAESWATRFRLESGRPLDEASPVLDTELIVSGGRARVAAITRPLSPDGIGFAFRRHRDKPWTFPLFVKSNMIDPFAAGLIWFLIDGSRTMLIAGTRSSGKTSFLGAAMVQIMPKVRIISTEDTLELPVVQLRNLGYNIERLKSRSVITRIETELSAEEALRTALRLGDSALILGEVRSTEAVALFEAMRIGALANVVAGTIHGESAYGVYDRIVNDLNVPKTSFKAMDVVIVCNTLRSPDGLSSFKRVVDITEIRKHWKEDPLQEGGFVNLLEYSAKDDILKPSNTLLVGESEVLSDIANRVREWKGRWDNVWSNINLRANIINTISEFGKTKPELLEASFVVRSNAMFHIISADVMKEVGSMDTNIIYDRWLSWIKNTM